MAHGGLGRFVFVLVLLNASVFAYSQKKWDGEGGDGNWENPLNWNGDAVPLSSDNVILDNSIVPISYDVFITGSSGSISCRSLMISPIASHSIKLFIPPSNLQSIALVTTGTAYTIELHEGAVLINSSGATTGAIMNISDSMKIENGARYIHRTPRGNAVIMNTISSAPGTERGVVEFDVPVASGSYIVSLTNRIFGTLVFSSNANNGNITYSSNGSNRVLIKGDLLINPRVSFSVGFNDTIIVKGNFSHQGNVFNLSNNGNPTVLQLEGDILLNPGSTITETNTAQPVILFSGNANQDCHIQGNLANEVLFKLQKRGTLILSAPLNLPFDLELKKGMIKTDSTNLLTLSSLGRIIADSLTIDSTYINGPIRKLGLASSDHFLFPVGKAPRMRWLELKNASGDFTVEFMKSNPYVLTSGMNGVDHISRIEYWTLESNSSAAASVELSFDNVNSGGVTDLSSLRVAQLSGSWTNQGNTATTGSAGGAGSVVSSLLFDFATTHRFFTLASSVPYQNPLPLSSIFLSSKIIGDECRFEWATSKDLPLQKFILEYSADQSNYHPVQQFDIEQRINRYLFQLPKVKNGWYRIRAINNEEVYFSNIVEVILPVQNLHVECATSIRSSQLSYSVYSKSSGTFSIQLFSSSGQLVARKEIQIKKGKQQVIWNIAGYFPNGVYLLVGFNEEERSNVIKLIRE